MLICMFALCMCEVPAKYSLKTLLGNNINVPNRYKTFTSTTSTIVHPTTGLISFLEGSSLYTLNSDWSSYTVTTMSDSPSSLAYHPLTNELYYSTYSQIVKRLDTGTKVVVAGLSATGYNGDGIATDISLSYPKGLHFTKSGVLYFCDSSNYLVRRLSDATGTAFGNIVTTVAGTKDTNSYKNVGYPATNTSLSYQPNQVAVLDDGTIYFTGLLYTFVVSPSGVLNRLSFYTDTNGALTVRNGKILVQLWSPYVLVEVSSDGTYTKIVGGGTSNDENVPALSVRMPSTMNNIYAYPNGDILFTESARIRKYSSNTGLVQTVIGCGDKYTCLGNNITSSLARSGGITGGFVSQDGRIVFADPSNYLLRQIDVNGVVTTIGGNLNLFYSYSEGNPAVQTFMGPCDVYQTTDGTMFVADRAMSLIRKIAADGTCNSILGKQQTTGNSPDGSPANTSTTILYPYSIFAFENGTVLYGEQLNGVRMITTLLTTFTGRGSDIYGTDIPAQNSSIKYAYSITSHPLTGDIYIADGNGLIKRVSQDGNLKIVAGTSTTNSADGILPTSTRVNANKLTITTSNDLYFSEPNTLRIISHVDGLMYYIMGHGITSAMDGTYDASTLKTLSLSNTFLLGVVNGTIYYADNTNSNNFMTRIRKIQPMCDAGSILNSNYTQCSTCPNGYSNSLNYMTCLPACFGVASDDPTVCSSNGKCTAVDTCQCSASFTGSKCNIPICFGLNASDSNACSGHGSCTAPNTCTCSSQYTGSSCQVPLCYGKPATDASVCSGHGSCSQPDVCTCNSQYFGSRCDVTTCFGIFSNSTTVCNNHGQCTQPDTCSCSGYTGSQCTIPLCFGLSAIDSLVCSGRGNCSSPNNCVCSSAATFFGDKCDVTTCFGIMSNTSSVCSGKGSCSAIDSCQCKSGYNGTRCENVIVTPKQVSSSEHVFSIAALILTFVLAIAFY